MGMRDRYLVAPNGTVLNSKKEMEAHRPRGKVQHLNLPEGWQVRYKVRQEGLKKGMRDRYLVAPDGTVLKSKKEMEAHLYLNSLSER